MVTLRSPLLTNCGVDVGYHGRVMIFWICLVLVVGTHVGHLVGLMLGQCNKNDAGHDLEPPVAIVGGLLVAAEILERRYDDEGR